MNNPRDGKPTKQQVRDWLCTRWTSPGPLPDLPVLRQQVGRQAETELHVASSAALLRGAVIATSE